MGKFDYVNYVSKTRTTSFKSPSSRSDSISSEAPELSLDENMAAAVETPQEERTNLSDVFSFFEKGGTEGKRRHEDSSAVRGHQKSRHRILSQGQVRRGRQRGRRRGGGGRRGLLHADHERPQLGQMRKNQPQEEEEH